jgi:hypothetical protein
MLNPYRNCPHCDLCGHHVIDMDRHLQSHEHRELSKVNRRQMPPFHISGIGNGKRKRVLLP